MNKKLLVLMGTSTFALSGCFSLIGMGVGAAAESRKGKEAENKSFAELGSRFDKADLAELSDELEELGKAHETWWQLYTSIDYYITTDEFGYKKLGSCLKERKNSDHCKKAVEMRGKVAHKIADVLHAAIEAKPVYGNQFPAFEIVLSQRYPDVAAAVDVEDSLTKVAQRWSEHWAKRVKKAGGAETLARKESAGACFFTSEPQSDNIKPRFAFTSSDDMFMRCAAPQSFSSYKRTEKDLVVVKMFNQDGHVKVDVLPGDAESASASHTGELSMSAFRKAMKSKDEESAGAEKPFRFVFADVTYSAYRKVGTRAVRTGDVVDYQDDIREEKIATGFAVIDMEAAGADDDDDDKDADEAEDEEPVKAKPAKKNRTAQNAGHKKGSR